MLWQESGRKPCRIPCRRSCHDANLRQFQQTCVYLLQKIVSDLQYSAVACSHLCRFAADFLLGLAGNQPLFTRFSCSKSSKMDQKEEKAATPAMVDHTMLCQKEKPPAAFPEMVLSLDDQRVAHSDDQECAESYDDSGKIHLSFDLGLQI